MASSEMFETLEEELHNLLESLDSRVEIRLAGSPYGEGRKKVISEIDNGLSEAQSLLRQLESEGRLAPSTYRPELTAKVRTHRAKVDKLNTRYRTVLASFGDRSNTVDPRRAVLEGQRALERTADSISRSTAVAIETEAIGNEVVTELGTQRETLVRTKERLVDTDVEISRSRKILRSMYLNMVYNKLILIGIILVEFVVLCIVVYLKWFK